MPTKNNNKYQNSQQDTRLCGVEEHIEIINHELGSVKTDVAQIKTDIDWLKRFFFIVATSSVGALIASLFNLLNQ